MGSAAVGDVMGSATVGDVMGSAAVGDVMRGPSHSQEVDNIRISLCC